MNVFELNSSHNLQAPDRWDESQASPPPGSREYNGHSKAWLKPETIDLFSLTSRYIQAVGIEVLYCRSTLVTAPSSLVVCPTSGRLASPLNTFNTLQLHDQLHGRYSTSIQNCSEIFRLLSSLGTACIIVSDGMKYNSCFCETQHLSRKVMYCRCIVQQYHIIGATCPTVLLIY